MEFLGSLLLLYSIVASGFKLAVSKGLRAFDFEWFRVLDQFGSDTGWILRYLIGAIGISLILLHKWEERSYVCRSSSSATNF